MSELIIYWGSKQQDTFEWRMQHKSDSETSVAGLNQAIPPIQSERLLKADLAAIAPMAEGRSLSVIIADEDTFSGVINMPQKARRHMRKAAPYMLEEQLATPVSELFFAYRPVDKEKVEVRAIERGYLESILQQFKVAGLKPESILTELDLLSPPEVGIDALKIEDKVLVCTEENYRWSAQSEDLGWLLQKFVSENAEEAELPVALPLRVFAVEEDADFVHQLPVGQFAVDHQVIEDPMTLFATDMNSAINLLQAEFAPKKEKSASAQWLSKVATILATLLAAHLIYQGSAWFSLSQQKLALEKEQSEIFKQAFRGRKDQGKPYRLMKSYVKKLGQSQGNQPFLTLLNSATEKMQQGDQIYPTNISYDGRKGELRLDLFAQSLEVLNSYRDALQSSGHQVDASSATQNGDGYTSRLTIRRG